MIICKKGGKHLTELNRIKLLRKEKSLTLDGLSNKIGISRATLNRYENGDSEPKIETWEKIANFFNVSVPYIMGFVDEKEDNNLSEDYISYIDYNLSLDSKIKTQLLNILDNYEEDNSKIHVGALNDILNEFSSLLQTLSESNNEELSHRYNSAALIFTITIDLIKQLYSSTEEKPIEELASIFMILHELYLDSYFKNTQENIEDKLISSAEASNKYIKDKKLINDILDERFLNGFNRRYD